MLTYLLVWVVGLGSLGMYLAAFFFPELHRKNDLIWSGIGMFYALVLWVYSDRIRGGFLLGQTAGVALLVWLGWQTFQLRLQLTPAEQKTPIPDTTALKEKLAGLINFGRTRLGSAPGEVKPNAPSAPSLPRVSAPSILESEPGIPKPPPSMPEPASDLEDEWDSPPLGETDQPAPTAPATSPKVSQQSLSSSGNVSNPRGQAQALSRNIDLAQLRERAQGVFAAGRKQLQRFGILRQDSPPLPVSPPPSPVLTEEHPPAESAPAPVISVVTDVIEVIQTPDGVVEVEILEVIETIESPLEPPVQPETEINEPEAISEVVPISSPEAAVQAQAIDVSEVAETATIPPETHDAVVPDPEFSPDPEPSPPPESDPETLPDSTLATEATTISEPAVVDFNPEKIGRELMEEPEPEGEVITETSDNEWPPRPID
jgi:hypothetical protein